MTTTTIYNFLKEKKNSITIGPRIINGIWLTVIITNPLLNM